MLKIGIPGGICSYTYGAFTKAFLEEMDMMPVLRKNSDKDILDKGAGCCADEVCMPVKLFAGHAKDLSEKCDMTVVPRIMQTEFGESLCPHMCALPELTGNNSRIDNAEGKNTMTLNTAKYNNRKNSGIKRNTENKTVIVTGPLFLSNQESLENVLWTAFREYCSGRKSFERALSAGRYMHMATETGYLDKGYRYRVFLAGHAYNLYDEFANLRLISKLHKMDIGVVTQERVLRHNKEAAIKNAGLIKKPYWSNMLNIYGAAAALLQQKAVDGIIYVSSFSCGIDSVVETLMRNNFGNVPFLTLKTDEQTGEAGYDTRLEAFESILAAKGARQCSR